MNKAVIYISGTTNETVNNMIAEVLERFCEKNEYEIVALLGENSQAGMSMPMKYSFIGMAEVEDIDAVVTLSSAMVGTTDKEVMETIELLARFGITVETAKEDMDEYYDALNSDGWERVGNVGSWSAGATPSRTNPEYYSGNVPWLKTGDLNDGYVSEVPEYISELALQKTSVRLNPAGSVLMAMYGATIGKLGILEVPMTTNQACCACIPFDGLYNKYLFYFLMGNRKNFIKMGEGGAQPNISKDKIVNYPIAIPPLAEQKRIVAKIEELLPYIDRYEKAWNRLEDLNKRFPADMQKSILQMAIQGKLVEQRPEEGTAEELYEQIQAEKKELIKAGKIKKEKPLPEITEDEIPFDIPDSWKWVRLSQLFSVLNGDRGKNYPAKSTLSHEGIPFISALNLDGKSVIEDDNLLRLSKQQYERLGNGKLIRDDIVVCIRGSLGKHGRYPFDKGAIASSLVILRAFTNDDILAEFLMMYLDTPLFFSEIRRYDNGTAQPNLAAKSLEQFLVPLPPLAEQKRIVAKLEEILPLCERLK